METQRMVDALGHNLSVHVVPKGTTLYRGRTERTYNLSDVAAWFAPDLQTASIYGYVDVYIVTRPLLLWNLADMETRTVADALYRRWAAAHRAPPVAVTLAYPLRDNKVVRNSTFDVDTLVSRWFVMDHDQKDGPLEHFDGFGTTAMPSEALHDTHHAEMFIVNPRTAIKLVETLRVTLPERKEEEIAYHNIQKRAHQQRMAQSRHRPRASPRPQSGGSGTKRRLDLEEEGGDENTEDPGPQALSFDE